MKNNKNSMIGYILIVIIFIGLLVYFTNNKKGTESGALNQNTNMQNTTGGTQENQGVKITTLKEGTGDEAKIGDMVSMNYTGKLADETVFDSNVDPKFQHVEPFMFTIGAGQVIKGWDVGVAGMKVGEKRNLLIQPDYAYGAQGIPGAIPGNAVLNFDVELVAINK